MITWTTYGTWLQGDERGYVKNGTTLSANDALRYANQKQQKCQTVILDSNQRQMAEKAILEEANRIGQKIFTLVVCSNHVHLVAEATCEPIEQVVRRYKVVATAAVRKYFPDKIWTKGYDKRFCFSQEDLVSRICYVERHKDN